MDLADLRRAANAAREFTHELGGVTYTLRVPTRFEVDCAAGRSGGVRSTESIVRLQREVVQLAIVGWAGMTAAAILGEHKHSAEEVPYDRDAVPLLLDEQPHVVDELWPLLRQRLEARNDAREVAQKNSPSASPGSDPRPMRKSSRARA